MEKDIVLRKVQAPTEQSAFFAALIVLYHTLALHQVKQFSNIIGSRCLLLRLVRSCRDFLLKVRRKGSIQREEARKQVDKQG